MARRVAIAVLLGAAVALVLGAESPAAAPSAVAPTFTRDIAPIIFQHCSTCHRPGEAGPFSLLTYADVRARARQIVAVTERRYMPPWKPDDGTGTFADARRLQPSELRLLEQWTSGGMIEGDAADLPVQPAWVEGWQLGVPDLVVTLPEGFTLRADGPDVIRNFVLPLPVTGVRYVRALEFRPGNRRVAHHATMLIDRTAAARRLDAGDAAPGYEGILPYTATQPDGHFLGWTPGAVAIRSEPDMAWQLSEGGDLVVSLHLRPSGKPEPVQFTVGLFFAAEAPRRTPVILQLGQQDLDIPAGATAFVTEDRYVLPVDVDVRAIQPHAHYLCRRVEATARRPDGTTETLIRISDWDFAWQAQYRYARPIALPRGTVIAMRYTYDNSPGNPKNPSTPARRVRYGQASDDEMAELLVQVLPRSAADRAVLERDFRVKARRDTIAGYETMLQAQPDSVSLHNDVAMLYLDGRAAGPAIAHFFTAARLAAGDREAHYNLGVALAMAGKTAEAVTSYRRALALSPDYAHAHNNLGAALAAMALPVEAAAHYREALRLEPGYVEARVNQAVLLHRTGHRDEAVAAYRMALTIAPRHAVALTGLGSALQARGETEAAMAQYQTAIDAAPDYADAHYNLASVLQMTGRTKAALRELETAAVLYAAGADVPRALDVLAAAQRLAVDADESALAAALAERIAAFERCRTAAGGVVTPCA